MVLSFKIKHFHRSINLMPAKQKVFLPRTLIEHVTATFQNYKLEIKLLGNRYNHVKYWSFKNQSFQSFHMVAALPL